MRVHRDPPPRVRPPQGARARPRRDLAVRVRRAGRRRHGLRRGVHQPRAEPRVQPALRARLQVLEPPAAAARALQPVGARVRARDGRARARALREQDDQGGPARRRVPRRGAHRGRVHGAAGVVRRREAQVLHEPRRRRGDRRLAQGRALPLLQPQLRAQRRDAEVARRR